jgi:hypothetical protein
MNFDLVGGEEPDGVGNVGGLGDVDGEQVGEDATQARVAGDRLSEHAPHVARAHRRVHAGPMDGVD